MRSMISKSSSRTLCGYVENSSAQVMLNAYNDIQRLDDEIAREPIDQEGLDKLVTDVDLFRAKIGLDITDVGDPIRCELQATEKSLDDLKSRLEE